MIMTGGYPAFIFLLLYLLTAIFILFVYEDIRKKNYRALSRFTGILAVSAVFTLLAGMVVITSVYHLPDAITRGSGVTLRQALFRVFFILSFISIAGYAFNEWRKESGAMAGKLRIALFAVAIVIAGFIVFTLVRGNLDFANFIRNQLLKLQKINHKGSQSISQRHTKKLA